MFLLFFRSHFSRLLVQRIYFLFVFLLLLGTALAVPMDQKSRTSSESLRNDQKSRTSSESLHDPRVNSGNTSHSSDNNNNDSDQLTRGSNTVGIQESISAVTSGDAACSEGTASLNNSSQNSTPSNLEGASSFLSSPIITTFREQVDSDLSCRHIAQDVTPNFGNNNFSTPPRQNLNNQGHSSSVNHSQIYSDHGNANLVGNNELFNPNVNYAGIFELESEFFTNFEVNPLQNNKLLPQGEFLESKETIKKIINEMIWKVEVRKLENELALAHEDKFDCLVDSLVETTIGQVLANLLAFQLNDTKKQTIKLAKEKTDLENELWLANKDKTALGSQLELTHQQKIELAKENTDLKNELQLANQENDQLVTKDTVYNVIKDTIGKIELKNSEDQHQKRIQLENRIEFANQEKFRTNKAAKALRNQNEGLVTGAIISAAAIISALAFWSLYSEQPSSIEQYYSTSYFVKIGNPGNLCDPHAYPYYWGSVNYEFEAGRRCVTKGEYLHHLNSVTEKEANFLYNDKMTFFRKRVDKLGFSKYELIDPAQRSDSMTCVSYRNAQYYCEWVKEISNKRDQAAQRIEARTGIVRTIYRLMSNDEYQKMIYYNPEALARHGAYEQNQKNYYQTETPSNGIAEWTSTPDSGKMMIRSGDFSNSFETADPDEVREDLGFRIVKVIETSSNKEAIVTAQKNREVEYDLSQSQDVSKSNEEKDLWLQASHCMKESQDQIDSPNLAQGYEEAASFYIEAIMAMEATNQCHQDESTTWEAAGFFKIRALTCALQGREEVLSYEEVIQYCFQAAKAYDVDDEEKGKMFWTQASDKIITIPDEENQ